MLGSTDVPICPFLPELVQTACDQNQHEMSFFPQGEPTILNAFNLFQPSTRPDLPTLGAVRQYHSLVLSHSEKTLHPLGLTTLSKTPNTTSNYPFTPAFPFGAIFSPFSPDFHSVQQRACSMKPLLLFVNVHTLLMILLLEILSLFESQRYRPYNDHRRDKPG